MDRPASLLIVRSATIDVADRTIMPLPPSTEIVAIGQLYARYCFAIDGLQTDELISCFTPDGTMEIVGARTFVGADGVRELLASRDARAPRHHVANLHVISVDGDTARARAYFTLVGLEGQIAGIGRYDDDLARADDGSWAWSHKRVVFDWRA
jgi:hypothetical protein